MSACVLGVSAHFHDSAAALVAGGRLVSAAAEERFTRVKHDSNFPAQAIEFCLRAGGISARDLDAIVFYEEPSLTFTRVLTTTLAGGNGSRRIFVGAMKTWLGDRLWTTATIARRLGVDARRVRSVPHHLSHAAQAFAQTPVGDAAVLTLDAVGEWSTASICRAVREAPGGRAIQILETIDYPHSLGLAYAAFTAFLGFRPNDGEASTMALAAFGRASYADDVRRIIRITEDGRYRVESGYFNFLAEGPGLFSPAFTALFGAPRDARGPIPFDALATTPSGAVGAADQHYADVAASIQLVLEEAVLALARRARRLSGSANLCLAGGVALNVVANSRLVAESGFERVYAPSDPGDGGAAVGAAWLEATRIDGALPAFSASPFLGESYPSGDVAAFLGELDPRDWQDGGDRACTAITSLVVSSPAQQTKLAAAAVLEGKIVGWFHGRFEFGPRALGARSLLADPACIRTARRLSARVKSRAPFRPYALSVRPEDVEALFEWRGELPPLARLMQMVMRVRPEARHFVRAAMHHDGTTRIQVCSPDDSPALYGLLCDIAKVRGVGAVLNTSFNEPGFPIVATPVEALLMFARSAIDILAVEDLMIQKVRTPAVAAAEPSLGLAAEAMA